jgi:hypothetical protein
MHDPFFAGVGTASFRGIRGCCRRLRIGIFVAADYVNTGRVLELRVGGRTIKTTAEHPFYARGLGWTAAGVLHPGDELPGHTGSWTAVESVADSGDFATVYNLNIEEDHTYFVGSLGWGFSLWAHNASSSADGGGSGCAGGSGSASNAPNNATGGKYSNLPDPRNVGAGKDFTPATKRKILEQNKQANGGVIKSDQSGTEAVPSVKSQSGVTPPTNEAQIDHIVPRSKDGTNSPSNAQVLTRQENGLKSDK